MKITFNSKPHFSDSSELLVLPFWEGPKPGADFSMFGSSIILRDFSAKQAETALMYHNNHRILLLGLGSFEKYTAESLRRAYSSVIRFAIEKKIKKISLIAADHLKNNTDLLAICEGILLTNYAFSYKSENTCLVDSVEFLSAEAPKGLSHLETICKGVCFARDLVNGNADDVTPKMLVDTALKLHPKVDVTIFDRKRLEQEKMGLILAVNRASNLDPYMIEASYKGNKESKDHIVLVGKGITYDTGGLSLKPTDSMVGMKCDMAGAGVVLAVIKTVAELGLKINLTVLAPVTENSIGSRSYKLGDVYKAYNGKTVEITNTDAEGRLILADALSYAVKNLKPTCMIDLATLTGAIMIGLGEEIAGLFSKDDEIIQDLVASSKKTSEHLWPMPIHDDYKDALKSEIADMVNSFASRDAGAVKAALFLQEFVGNVPWAHIDLAGPAYLSKPKYYHRTKATGYGVRMLVEFLMRRSG